MVRNLGSMGGMGFNDMVYFGPGGSGGASIGTPVVIGKNENVGSLTTNVDVPAGSLIVVFVSAWASTNGTLDYFRWSFD